MDNQLKVIVTNVMLCGCLLALSGQCGCQPDPRKQAEANAINARTHVTETAAAVAVSATATAVYVESSINAATEDEQIAARERLIQVAGIGLILACIIATFVICGLVIRTGQAADRLVAKTEEALEKRAEIAAASIRVDRATRTLPVLVGPPGGTENLYVNLNTGQVGDMRGLAPPNHALVAVDHRLREVGLFADAAVQIARYARSDGPARDLPGIAAGVPTLAAPIPDPQPATLDRAQVERLLLDATDESNEASRG